MENVNQLNEINIVDKLLNNFSKEELHKIISIIKEKNNILDMAIYKKFMVPDRFHEDITCMAFDRFKSDDNKNDKNNLNDKNDKNNLNNKNNLDNMEHYGEISFGHKLRIYVVYIPTKNITKITIEEENIKNNNNNNKCGRKNTEIFFDRDGYDIKIGRDALNILDNSGYTIDNTNGKMLGMFITNLVYYVKDWDNVPVFECDKMYDRSYYKNYIRPFRFKYII